MTPRKKFIMALQGKQPLDHVPTCEIEFHLTMELLGKIHPGRRNLSNWDQMSGTERKLQVADAGDLRVLQSIEDGEAPRVAQDDSQATFAPRLEPGDEALDFTKSAETVHNRIRALSPEPGGWCYWRV